MNPGRFFAHNTETNSSGFHNRSRSGDTALLYHNTDLDGSISEGESYASPIIRTPLRETGNTSTPVSRSVRCRQIDSSQIVSLLQEQRYMLDKQKRFIGEVMEKQEQQACDLEQLQLKLHTRLHFLILNVNHPQLRKYESSSFTFG